MGVGCLALQHAAELHINLCDTPSTSQGQDTEGSRHCQWEFCRAKNLLLVKH